MRLTSGFGNNSIRVRIGLLIVLNSSLALASAGIALFGYESFLQRGAASRQLSAQAGIIAESSTAALSFSDEAAAEQMLSALRGDSQIIEGIIYDADNRPFARYARTGSPISLPARAPRPPGVYFESGSVLVFEPVRIGNEMIGTIFLKSTNALRGRLERYIGIVCLILFLSQGLAMLLSARMQMAITKPITDLANVARRVSTGTDYAVRAVRGTGGEIGTLIDSFNHMLSQIEVRELARKTAEESLRESEERYALAARGANDGLWDWNLTTNQIYFSSRWNQMLGRPAQDRWADPEEWFTRIHPSDCARVKAEIAAHREGVTEEFSIEYRMHHKNGSYIWVLTRAIIVRNTKGSAVRMAGSQTDITEGKILDPLTALPNRLYFIEKLELAIDAARRGGDGFAVLFLDLDGFKTVNDSLGHAAGDKLLTRVAGRLLSAVRDGPESRSSVVVRLGGDEFAILINDIRDPADAEITAQRVLKTLEPPFRLKGRQVFSTASIGIARGSPYITPEEMLHNADTAMYHAKARGKARFAVFDEAMRERAVARLEIETGLRKAITAGEFVVYYQPELSLKDKQVIGYEALVRWNHPELGMLPPSEFIPIAEESDLIVHLGRWVLREACAQMAEWHRRFPIKPPLFVSVNLSQRELRHAGLIGNVKDVLAETGLDPRYLKLEMTESSIMQNPENALEILRQLKLMHIGLEIDDFGTGYSSLSYLRCLPFDAVKIDRSFIRELGHRGGSLEIVKTIIDLAQNLQMEVVAEGIETEDQLQTLASLGCETGQGYYFSKPASAQTTQALMRERSDIQRAFAILQGGAPAVASLQSRDQADGVCAVPDAAVRA